MINYLRTLLAHLIIRWLSWLPSLVASAWGWLMTGTGDMYEKRHCLEEILRLEPDNEWAAMELLRAQQQQRALQRTASDEVRESTGDSLGGMAEREAASSSARAVELPRVAPSLEGATTGPTEDATELVGVEVISVAGTDSTSQDLSDDASPQERALVSGTGLKSADALLTTMVPPECEPGSPLPTSTREPDEADLTTELQPSSDSLPVAADIEFGEDVLPNQSPGESEGITIVQAPISTETLKRKPAKRRAPRQYRPPVRPPRPPREASSSSQETTPHKRVLSVEVRMRFERGGFLRVSLLARRQPELPEEITVSGTGGSLDLVALQEDRYQDIIPSDVGALLRQGIEWEGVSEDGHQFRWSLSGRDLYILSAHSDLSGFVSTPRLVLGKEHVVLCASARLRDVQDVIEQTGSPTPTLLDSAVGIPVGWVGLQGVLPRTPVPQSTEQDILNVLRPLPDAEIVLEGGIRLEYTTWLAGHPPRIRLYGDSDAISEVMIDGKAAAQGPDGSYTVEGWDLPGSHVVWCTSSSRTYSIEESAEEWDTWHAYSWAVYDQSLHRRRPLPTICGALVVPKLPAYQDFRTVVLPATNPVAIGHKPGEIYRCKVRTDIHPDFCIGFAPFEPVWALPADPYHSDKRVARVVLVGDTQPVQRHCSRANPEQIEPVLAWYSVVLAAGRKGLRTEPDTGEVTALWRAYKRQAKALWKKLR